MFRSSGLPVFRSSGLPVFRSSGLFPFPVYLVIVLHGFALARTRFMKCIRIGAKYYTTIHPASIHISIHPSIRHPASGIRHPVYPYIHPSIHPSGIRHPASIHPSIRYPFCFGASFHPSIHPSGLPVFLSSFLSSYLDGSGA